MEKKDYILGLDLGVGSVGWSCMELDKDKEPRRLIAANSIIFPSENGSMEDRRVKRGMRRLVRRKKSRVKKVKNLFITYNLMNKEMVKNFYIETAWKYDNPYQIKAKGLHDKLDVNELMIALVHYAKYRGFKSNRKANETGKDAKSATEEQRLLFSITQTQTTLKEKGCTISEFILSDEKFKDKIKNTDGEYNIGITREMILNEASLLLEKQVEFGLIKEEFAQEYLKLLSFQRSFSKGPDSGPYHDPLKKMIGLCSFDGQERAPLCSPSYELFNLLQKLTDIRFYEKSYKENQKLNKEQLHQLVTKAINGKEIKYKDVRDVIGNDVNFTHLTLYQEDYKKLKNIDKNSNKTLEQQRYELKLDKSIYKMTMTKYISSQFKKAGIKLEDLKVMDIIAELLCKYKSDDEIKENIEKYELLKNNTDEFKQVIVNLDEGKFKGFGKLSFHILYDILPVMRDNALGYSDAMNTCGYDHTNRKTSDQTYDELPQLKDIFETLDKVVTNRCVVKTLQETKLLINAVIAKYGKPYEIHIEVARELTKNETERKRLINDQLSNRADNLTQKQQLVNKGHFASINNIKHDDLIKYRLFMEQGGLDPYTLAATGDESKAKINESQLFSEEYEIDHIMPYSRSFNDTFQNKVLVSKKMNQQKGNRLPYEAFHLLTGWNKYVNWIKSVFKSSPKAEHFLMENITEEMVQDFSARAINDTRYATKTLCSILNYYFPDIRIRSFTGQITSKLRSVWNLNNLTHSYQASDYRLKNNNDEILKSLNDQMTDLALYDTFNEKEKKELKDKIIKLEREIDKKNRSNHLHHALDATIIACATDTLRRRVEIHEQYLRQKAYEDRTFRNAKIDPITGEFKGYEYKNIPTMDTSLYFDMTKNLDPKHFPVPYLEFREEVIARIYERDEIKMRNTLRCFSNYTNDEIAEAKPLLIYHTYTKKVNGRLHKETIYGVASNPEERDKQVLTQRVSITTKSFNMDRLNTLYDVNGTQKEVYQAVKDWMGSCDDGEAAYKLHNQQLPVQKNGNTIKKVKLNFNSPKEQICIHKDKQQYVDKDNVIQIHVFKKEGSNHLYFVGMDRYRVLNLKNDPDIIVWWGLGDNYKHMKYSDLKNEGFEFYLKLYKGQTIDLRLNKDARGICVVTGFSTGLFEISSIMGDDYDLVYNKFKKQISGRSRIPVSRIEDIEIVNLNILGEIK